MPILAFLLDTKIDDDDKSDIYNICVVSSEFVDRIYGDAKEFLDCHVTNIKGNVS